MGFLMNELGLSERRSCRIVGLSRSVQQYCPAPKSDVAVVGRLKELASENRRYGYLRLHAMLRREGLVANRKNLIVMLMAIELILLAVNINLVAFSNFLGDLVGQVFAMFVLTVAAGEAAIGLAILVIYFRSRGTIAVDDVNRMKG